MKKIKYILILLLSLTFTNALAEDYSTDDDNVRITLPLFVNYNSVVFSDKSKVVKIIGKNEVFTDENIEITIHRPLIKMDNSTIEKNINLKIEKIIEDFKERIYKEAQLNNEYYKENKLPLKKYIINVNNAIHYNKENILSLTLNLYSYLGGAHGATENISLNIDTNTGNVGVLEDFLGNNHGYDEIILKKIKSEVSKNEGLYFKNEVDKITKLPYDQKFYIEDNFIVVYFDEYSIAPYVAGSPEFKIELSNFPNGLNKISIKEESPIVYYIVEEEGYIKDNSNKYISVLQLKEYVSSSKYNYINSSIKKEINNQLRDIYERGEVKGITSYNLSFFCNKNEITFETTYIIDRGDLGEERVHKNYLVYLNSNEIKII